MQKLVNRHERVLALHFLLEWFVGFRWVLGGIFFFFFNREKLEISKTTHAGTCGYEIILLFQKPS